MSWNHSPEAIEKIRAAAKGRKHTSETKEKMSLVARGREFSPEHKKNLSLAMKGRPSWNRGQRTPREVREKISASNKGRISPNKGIPMSEEQKEKLRGQVRSPETRVRIAEAKRGTKASPEARAKMSASRMGRPGTMNGRCHTVEARAKMSKAGMGNQRSLGFKQSSETKRKIGVASRVYQLKHFEAAPLDCECAVHKKWRRNKRTGIELVLEDLLAEFPEVEVQKSFGRYCIDAYLPPPYHLAFEADGMYWHDQKKESDVKRDAELLRRFGLPVVRLSEEELCQISKLVSSSD